MKPKARKSGIFPEKLPEEVVLYDKTNDKVHCLKRIAAEVWESSDGSKTVEELARIVKVKTGAPADRKLVLQAVKELQAAGLMEAGSAAGLTSRREAVGKIAMAGSALVVTIVAAAPKAHASARAPADPPPLPVVHNPPAPPKPTGPKPPVHPPVGPPIGKKH
jgi:hypothetical protein